MNGCKNRSKEKRRTGKSAEEVKGWHVVPYDEDRRVLRFKWVKAINRPPPYPREPKDFVICGEHFEDTCFVRDLKFELGCSTKRTFSLVENAVPTIFSYRPTNKKRVFSEENVIV